MEYVITGSGYSWNWGARGVEEIIQNVAFILATVKESCPMDRDFALDGGGLDMPINLSQAIISSRIVEAVRDYEPRVEISEITFDQSETGKLIPKVRVKINDES